MLELRRTLAAVTACHAAADVLAIADAFGLERFAVVGRSGGGPHALACAASRALAGRLGAAAVVSAPGPLDEVPGAWEALGEHMRPTAEMARRIHHSSNGASCVALSAHVAAAPVLPVASDCSTADRSARIVDVET